MKRVIILAKSTDTWFQLPPDVRLSFKSELAKRHSSVCSKNNGNGCGKYFPLHMMSVDHIIPISMGGPVADILNMQLLCFKCHRKKTRTLDRRGRTFEFLLHHFS
jgi:5-methylcytosine-specific restriction endonuclease McrA